MRKVGDFVTLLKYSESFDDLEVRIIEALINLKRKRVLKATAGIIATEAGVSVTNAYKYLYSLQKKGVVEFTEKNKIKTFWLSVSCNPFPRIFSKVREDYLKKEKAFKRLERMYEDFVNIGDVWSGEKVKAKYNGDYTDRVAFMFDIARQEVLITTPEFYTNVTILDAIKRAVQRDVSIKVISERIHPELVSKLKQIGIEMRLGNSKPNVIIVDGRHGVLEDGVWFLNYMTTYRDKFKQAWTKASSL